MPIEKMGLFFSIACAIHCMTLPIFLFFAPYIASSFAFTSTFEWILVSTSFLLALILLILSGSIYCQNVLSVPFNNGFVGDNTANNVSSNSYYQSDLGWTNIQFAQNSSGSAFVSQGNDIVGMVIITDNNATEIPAIAVYFKMDVLTTFKSL